MRWDPKSGEGPAHFCSWFDSIATFIDDTVVPFFSGASTDAVTQAAVDSGSTSIPDSVFTASTSAAGAAAPSAAPSLLDQFGNVDTNVTSPFGTSTSAGAGASSPFGAIGSTGGNALTNTTGAAPVGSPSWWESFTHPTLGQAVGLSGAGNLIGGVGGAFASNAAAGVQASAARLASDRALQAGTTAQGLLEPFRQLGVGAVPQLQALTGTNPGGNPLTAALTKPFNPSDLTNTPGYKFTLQQGLQGTENGYASQGLARSGAALKGAATFATGLADTTYNQQLTNYLTQNRQIYDMLSGQVSTGENAAAGAGNLGVGAASASNNFLTSGAAATAGGIVGGANSLSGAGNSLGQNALLFNILNQNQTLTNSLARANGGTAQVAKGTSVG